MAKKKQPVAAAARVLVATHGYQPNAVVVFPADVRDALLATGAIDDHPEAVAYCVDELGAEVRTHETEAGK
jgi:hypothetical protein